MGRPTSSTILLLLLGALLLMLGFSGRFQSIFAAAFPSFAGAGTSSSAVNPTTLPSTTPGAGNVIPNDPGTPPPSLGGSSDVSIGAGGYVPGTGTIVPNGNGGFTFQ